MTKLPGFMRFVASVELLDYRSRKAGLMGKVNQATDRNGHRAFRGQTYENMTPAKQTVSPIFEVFCTRSGEGPSCGSYSQLWIVL
ncbi:hypothetical protein AOC05_03590 [Arthrobacter alpinus]|uniref:Uncharacterized protein n=1 Tax=Arthrobacter alpinus TaxID=656366 RepID=A0A0M4RMH8_9MICC|nr:hypothetical protein AOC05_03590 [Arthrobacter alpinus]